MKIALLALTSAALALGTLLLSTTANAQSPRPSFVGIKDGDTVTDPVVVKFQASPANMAKMDHMGDMPVGMAMEHVHLIIDAPLPAPGAIVPMDSKHLHLMHGEQRATLHLSTGDHTLQLLMAGSNHRVPNPEIASDKITIHVIAKKP